MTENSGSHTIIYSGNLTQEPTYGNIADLLFEYERRIQEQHIAHRKKLYDLDSWYITELQKMHKREAKDDTDSESR